MPQNQTTPKNDNETVIDPQENPVAFVMQNKDALKRMPEDKQIRFGDMLFRRYMAPKYQKLNLSSDEFDQLKLRFVGSLLDIPGLPPIDLKGPAPKYGALAKTGAALEAGGAGVLGGIRTISELVAKLDKTDLSKDPLHQAISRAEGKAYESAKEVSPEIAHYGAGTGHQIPAAVMAEGAGSLLPKLASGAPLGLRAVEGAARGGVEGATFGATIPSQGSQNLESTITGKPSQKDFEGDAKNFALWGGALGAAFPFLGKLFGLGKSRLAVKESESVIEKTAETTTKETPRSLGDVADAAAKAKFGKAFKDLTSAEKAQMPSVMKEEIAKQQAQKAATQKAEKAAAKASKEAEAEAQRTAKAKAASEKAAQQAQKRATSPVQKQAVAAKAAEENPSVAKIMTPTERRVTEGVSPTGTERRVRIASAGPGGIKLEKTEGEKLSEQIRQSSAKQGRRIEEGEALQHIMKDAQRYEAFKKLGSKEQGAELVKAKNEIQEIESKTTKISEGVEGKKVRAKGGQPASPAQQKADAERIAAKRAEAKQQEFGAALEKHAQELAGRYTPSTQVGVQYIPELESAVKEFPGHETVLSGLQKLRRAKKISDEIYADSLKEWLMNQFGAAE